MPFNAAQDELYQEEIKPAIESVGLTSVRIDQLVALGPLISTLWQHIQDARCVIADLSGKNPNVFYELGLAHAAGKPTVILSQSVEDVPFDLQHMRIIRYDRTLHEAGGLKRRVSQALKEIVKQGTDFVVRCV